jgi:hypothetical protein
LIHSYKFISINLSMGKQQHKPPSAAPAKSTPGSKAASGESQTANAFTWPIAIIIVIIIAYVWQTRGDAPVEDLSNATTDELKDAMFGETPYMFYCDRRNSPKKPETIPKSFTALSSQYKSQMGFAVVNCSQVLPSGVNLWDKFKLRREWRPAVFATAPWMRLKQIPVNTISSSKALQKFVDVDMRAQAGLIVSDTDFTKQCAFAKQDESTCIVIVKGSKYTEAQAEIEEKMVKKYPKVKFGKITGSVSTFNFETTEDSKKKKNSEKLSVPAASEYALRLYAIRDGTHYLPMTYSPTWNYIDTFVTHAINAPTEDFHPFGDSSKANTTIHLTKKGSSFKKRRPKVENTGSSGSSTKFSSIEEEENAARIEEVRKRREQRRKEGKEREKARIEQMEREMAQNEVGSVEDGEDDLDGDEDADGASFEEEGDDYGDEGEGEEGAEEEEELIEL